jgi:DNA-binding IclR family transcriptional regulator
VTLTVPVPGGRVYVDQIVSTHEVKMTVELGRRFPLHAGSSGKCMLAFLPQAQREEILTATLTALTDSTQTDSDALRGELAAIRKRGYASSLGERQADAGSVASPLFGLDGDIRGSVSVCGPRSRFTPQFVRSYAPHVIAAAQDISTALGWAGSSSPERMPALQGSHTTTEGSP